MFHLLCLSDAQFFSQQRRIKRKPRAADGLRAHTRGAPASSVGQRPPHACARPYASTPSVCPPRATIRKVQFLKLVASRKAEALKAAAAVAGPFKWRNYTLRVELVCGIGGKTMRPRVWRSVRVSGGLTLHALHDKVLIPALGWTRNLHAYTFTCVNEARNSVPPSRRQ